MGHGFFAAWLRNERMIYQMRIKSGMARAKAFRESALTLFRPATVMGRILITYLFKLNTMKVMKVPKVSEDVAAVDCGIFL